MYLKKILLPSVAATTLFFVPATHAKTPDILDMQKIEISVRNQEKELNKTQQEAWDFFKQTDAYKNMLPELKKRLVLKKISSNPRLIYIPADTFTIFIYKHNQTVRLHSHHIKPELFIPCADKAQNVLKAPVCYVSRPQNSPKSTDKDIVIDLVYQKVNEIIHHLVTFTKSDLKKHPYPFNSSGSFIETPTLYMKPLSKEQQEKIGLHESDEETLINDTLGRPLTKEQILNLNGTTGYCQFWFSHLSHYSVGKRAHDFFSIAYITPLTQELESQVQNAVDETIAYHLEREFSALPKKVKQLPCYQQVPQEMDTLAAQLTLLYETFKQANFFKANECMSIAHTKAFKTLLFQSQGGQLPPSLAQKGILNNINNTRSVITHKTRSRLQNSGHVKE